jgi:hypothetical protein
MGGPLSSAHGHREGLMPPLTDPLDWFIVTPTSITPVRKLLNYHK